MEIHILRKAGTWSFLIVLFGIFLICFYGKTAVSAETTDDRCFEYQILEDRTAEITKYVGSDEAGSKVIIPSEIEGITVTSIGKSAFYTLDENGLNNIHRFITNIYIPDSVTTIKDYAFYECRGLMEINIPDGVTYIGDSAFGSCENLIEISIPQGLTEICYYTFSFCERLKRVEIPDGVEVIKGHAFYGCERLMEIKIPSTVTVIGEGAFANCKTLPYIVIPEGITRIGKSTFQSCKSLVSVKIPDSVTYIGENAFDNCISLNSINIPKNVGEIDNFAFYDCYSLKNVIIPSGVTNIGRAVFSGSEIVTIVCPENSYAQKYAIENEIKYTNKNENYGETSIGGDCGKNAKWKLENGTLYIYGSGAMDNYSLESRPEWNVYRADIKSVVIENGITSIGDMSFYECYEMEKVDIADSVSDIGEWAFSYCRSLESVAIPEKVTVLRLAVFAQCNKLTNISYKNVTRIEIFAFEGIGAQKVTIGKKVKELNPRAFVLSSIKEYRVEDGNPIYSSKDGVIYMNNGKTLALFPVYCNTKSYSIPRGVEKIGDSAFYDSDNIQELIIPDTVKSIGEYSFDCMNSLKTVSLPDSVITVGEGAFYSCSGLESVKIGNGLKKISDAMFKDCSRLKSIDLGLGVEELGIEAFSLCTSLKNVTLSNNVRKIDFKCFWECSNLSEVNLNENLELICSYAFYGCKALKTIQIPNGTSHIQENAFSNETKIQINNPNLKPFGNNGYRFIEYVSITGERKYDMSYEVLRLVNKERKKESLPELKMDESLLEASMKRASEINVCYSHTRSDGSSCFSINDRMMAENIAQGQTSARQVMRSWMDSEGHRRNILLKSAKTIGIGCYKHNGTYSWVQCFGTDEIDKEFDKPENKIVTEDIALATEAFNEYGNTESISEDTKWYKYKFKVVLNKKAIRPKEKTVAKLIVINAGNSSVKVVVNANSITKWESTDKKVAVINPNGRIRGKSKGKCRIKGALQYYKASCVIKISKAK